MPALREIPAPPELSPLQATLAQAEVVAEMSNPAGLRLDEPIVDPVTQYKHDLRVELAGHPQDLTTQLAAKGEVAQETIPTPILDEEPPEPPEVVPPELVEIQPTEGNNQVPTNVKFIGGPFDAQCVAQQDGVDVATTLSTENQLFGEATPVVLDADSTVQLSVRQGEHVTAALPFTFKQAAADAPAAEPETVTGTPVVEGA
jgi:hypothetical protein